VWATVPHSIYISIYRYLQGRLCHVIYPAALLHAYFYTMSRSRNLVGWLVAPCPSVVGWLPDLVTVSNQLTIMVSQPGSMALQTSIGSLAVYPSK